MGIFDKDRDENELQREARTALKEIFEEEWHFWLAYHADFSEMVAFPTEIDALRYAVQNHMSVKKIYSGFSLRYDSYQL